MLKEHSRISLLEAGRRWRSWTSLCELHMMLRLTDNAGVFVAFSPYIWIPCSSSAVLHHVGLAGAREH